MTNILNRNEPLSEQQPKKAVLIEMFRAGPQISSTGHKMLFTEKDLDDVVQSYDFKNHEAPLIIGHDQQDDTPALGWVREVWRKGKSLWGKVQLTPKAEQIIKDGEFKKVSSSFYLPEAENNPAPGKLSLRHLGLVSIPAVKGLTAFSEIVEDTITFTPDHGEFSISFKENLENTVIMARKAAKSTETPDKSVVDHGEMTVNINIGSGGDGKSSANVYDDGGNKVQESGPPADYQMEYASDEDPEALPPEEGDEEAPEGLEDPEDGAPEEDPGAEDPEAAAPPGAGGGAETEDVSQDVDGGDERIAQLASEYDISELIKALALAAESSDMTEGMNYSELPEALQKKIDEKKAEKERTEHGEEVDEVTEHAEEEKEEDEEETVDHACGSTHAEESEPKATRALDHSESAVGDRGTIDLQTRVAELEAELAQQRKLMREKEISDFVEGVFETGKLVESVVSKVDLVRFMETLNAKNAVNFSEKGKASQFDFFKGVLESLPSMVSFEEVATPASAPSKRTSSRAPSVDGFVCDPAQAELHDKALSYAEEKGVDFATAIKAVITEAESI